jgi:hypothetical protein
MTVALKGFKQILKSSIAVSLIAIVMLSPSSVNAQSAGVGTEDSYDEPAGRQSSNGNGPWGNSAGSTIGTPDISTPGTNANGSQGANPLGPGGGTLGRPLGPTPDATGGPGGNPDVPFDTNMNLIFLGTGIIFAYVVYRRRFKLKPVVAEKK